MADRWEELIADLVARGGWWFLVCLAMRIKEWPEWLRGLGLSAMAWVQRAAAVFLSLFLCRFSENTAEPAMTHQTVIFSDIDAYLRCGDDTIEERAEQVRLRNERVLRFPHAVMLQVAFPEVDFINRWCWTNFGTRDGECWQDQSEYRACTVEGRHSHDGDWTDHWFVKTDYNFGFNEWYFANQLEFESFVNNISSFNWGEHYPK